MLNFNIVQRYFPGIDKITYFYLLSNLLYILEIKSYTINYLLYFQQHNITLN